MATTTSSSGRGCSLAGLSTRRLLGLLRSEAFGATSLGSAPLIIPPLEGFLAWVVRTLGILSDHDMQSRLFLNVGRCSCSPMGAGSPAPPRLGNVAVPPSSGSWTLPHTGSIARPSDAKWLCLSGRA